MDPVVAAIEQLPEAPNPGLFRVGSQTYHWADVLAFAVFHARARNLEQRAEEGLAALDWAAEEGLHPSADDLQQDLTALRYRLRLISSAETERWLQSRELSVDELQDFLQRAWARRLRQERGPLPSTAGDPDRSATILWAEAVFTETLPALVDLLLSRVLVHDAILRHASLDEEATATAREAHAKRHGLSLADVTKRLRGEHGPRYRRFFSFEARYVQYQAETASRDNIARRLDEFRGDLLWVEFEAARFPNLAAAREARLCVNEDDESLAEVAARARVDCDHRAAYTGELSPDTAQALQATPVRSCHPPVADGESWIIRRLLAKREPDIDNEEVQDYVRQRLLQERLARHRGSDVTWLMDGLA